jgi:hypothetical protein
MIEQVFADTKFNLGVDRFFTPRPRRRALRMAAHQRRPQPAAQHRTDARLTSATATAHLIAIRLP